MWTAVKALLEQTKAYEVCVYSGGNEGIEEILLKVKNNFGIFIPPGLVKKVKLESVCLIEASKYPVGTLFFQFLGSIFLMHEVLIRRTPSLLIDTHGQPFGYYLSMLAGVPILAYVHYPLISTDMIQKVRERRPSYNNSSNITSTVSVSRLKLLYYKLLITWYSTAGYFCKLALCNSTWTYNHMQTIWSCPLSIVYPPCDIEKFLSIPLHCKKELNVISIGQFRPEKDHELQILAMKEVVTKNPQLSKAKLILVGSCRDEGDQTRVENLKKLAKSLFIQDNVQFYVNVPYTELLSLVQTSMIGLHSMWNEHFGICVVELMASGLITIAHNSAGPKEDIISHEKEGFLASTPEEYSGYIARGLIDFSNLQELRENARVKVRKFSQDHFESRFKSCIQGYL